MKQKLLLTFALLLTAVTGAWADLGDQFVVNHVCYTITSESPYEVSVSGYEDGLSANLVIPASVTNNTMDYAVTSIGNSAFSGCSSLTSVTISASVTEIGTYAFNGCTNLATVTFASGSQLTSIGLYAFLNSGLTSITIPASVTSIGMQAFDRCFYLATVSGCEGVTNVGSYAFDNTAWLTAQLTEHPDDMVYIGKVAYYGKNVSGVVSINTGTVSISPYAFYSSTDLTAVSIPASVESIGNRAFSECTNLTTVTFASGSQLTTIGERAFYGCNNESLTSIAIPASVTSIGDYAFSVCRNLATITVDGGNTTYDSRNNCNAIIDKNLNKLVVGCKGTTIPNTVTSIGNYAFFGSGLTSITIPASVESIGDNAFYNSSSLASVTVYATTPPTLGDDAFYFCNGSLKIYVFSDLVDTYKGATNWSTYSSKITAMTNPNGTCGVAPNASDVRWVLTGTTPNYTLTIMKVGSTGAMEEFSGPNFQPWKNYRTSIASVGIEDGVTSISDYAFDGCTGLTSVTIGSGVTTIGDYTFKGCNNASLTSITIPASVTSIGQDAFESCTNLASVNFASGSLLTSIGGDAFSRTGLTTIEIPAKVTTIGSSAFGLCSSLGTVNFATGSLLTTIDFSAFEGCTNLTSITLPNGIKTIGDGAFSGCTGLTSFTLPASVTNIGMSAFDGCNNLGTVTLNSNPYIGIGAFDYIKAGATVTMNLTANEGETGQYWATFYNENYNFQADANTQVFKAALSDTKVSLTELATDKIVNKDNAVLLKSTASPIVMTLTSTNSENVFTGNDLNGVSDPAGKTDDGKMYVLNYTAANGVGFYKLATGRKLGVGKAYLSYSGGGASNFFGLDDDGTTGIDNGQWTIDNSDKVFYDLNGRRVMNPTKGLYIVNGKKIVIK